MSEKAITTSPSAVSRGEIGAFDLRPAGQIFDRVTDCGANAFGDQ